MRILILMKLNKFQTILNLIMIILIKIRIKTKNKILFLKISVKNKQQYYLISNHHLC
jgi:hypothetical protein